MLPALTVLASMFHLNLLGDVRGEVGIDIAQGVRTIEAEGIETTSLALVELRPHALLYRGIRPRLSLSYAPILSFPAVLQGDAAARSRLAEESDIAIVPSSSVLHTARLTAEATTGRWQLASSLDGSFGRTQVVSGEGEAIDAAPTSGSLSYMSAELTLGAALLASGRSTYSLRTTTFVSGGASPEALASLPLYRGVRADAALDWNAGLRDVLSLQLSALGTRFGDEDNDTLLTRLGGAWSHHLGRHLRTRTGAGVVAVLADGGHWGGPAALLGWGEVALDVLTYRREEASYPTMHNATARPSGSARLSLEPGVDRLTGLVQLRSQGEMQVAWAPARLWYTAARGSVAALDVRPRSGDTLPTIWVARSDARVGREMVRGLWAYASISATRQSTARPDALTFTELSASLHLAAQVLAL